MFLTAFQKPSEASSVVFSCCTVFKVPPHFFNTLRRSIEGGDSILPFVLQLFHGKRSSHLWDDDGAIHEIRQVKGESRAIPLDAHALRFGSAPSPLCSAVEAWGRTFSLFLNALVTIHGMTRHPDLQKIPSLPDFCELCVVQRSLWFDQNYLPLSCIDASNLHCWLPKTRATIRKQIINIAFVLPALDGKHNHTHHSQPHRFTQMPCPFNRLHAWSTFTPTSFQFVYHPRFVQHNRSLYSSKFPITSIRARTHTNNFRSQGRACLQ